MVDEAMLVWEELMKGHDACYRDAVTYGVLIHVLCEKGFIGKALQIFNEAVGVAKDADVPYFKGDNYNLWALMMKTLFRSKDLWKLVEKGFSEEGDATRINESLKKDAKAMYLIQRALDPRILQGESVHDFVSRVLDIVYQLRALKQELPQKTVVSKILRSLTPRFSQAVHSIIEAKDLNTLIVKQLSGSLKNHEAILNIEGIHLEGEKALHAGRGFQHHFDGPNKGGRGRGGHPLKGRGCRCGRSIEVGRIEPSRGGEPSKHYNSVQCFICKKFGHVKSQCWYRNKEANVTKDEKE
ncbi:uncharacterized protein LOC120265102 [Dioscorea cayenensis subsp. rotundata]|uniref:Uncharacterized protein LOC120265102 n=1 Tax=Dioscorea cayennensis subsp. rotundata TaxID=55577 RepID=A0AB40BNI7_DIOCR|nr:uncharacterized protein LOC120265102 [Dioscorea cayenensis subsp. rotundata]